MVGGQERRRVVVTGFGMVTPLGIGVERTWQGLIEGRSAITPIRIFDASTYPTSIAAQVPEYDLAEYVPEMGDRSHLGRNERFTLTAAMEAYRASGLPRPTPLPRRTGVYLGSGEGAMDFPNFAALVANNWRDGHVDVPGFLAEGRQKLNAIAELEQEPNMPAGYVAQLFGAQGYNSNCLTACAASSQAIGEATDIIRRGDADIMIAGGSHSMIHPLGMAGFNLLTALAVGYNEQPEKASRPFDLRREGFVLGEGAGMLIMEELGHARRRGARIHGEVIGYGSTADAFRITDSHPEGRGAEAAMRGALLDAGISPAEIDYINAHGTSTEVNDRVETMAIKMVLGERAYRVPVSSTKSMMGHLIAAAGAVEAIICLLAIRDGLVPPTINYEAPDPACDLDYVPNKARRAPVRAAMSNSFGFGGQNVCLVLRRFEEP
jgi:3-oxoacyl-[acyl-carrier-protein] synthase II